MFTLFRALDSRKRSREEHQVSLKRLKLEHRERDKEREERERVRWHEREVLRLQIQLERAKRGETATDIGEEDDFSPHRDPAGTVIAGANNGGVGSSTGVGGGSGEMAPLQHLQHHLESHEREREDDPRLDLGGATHHHQQHLQPQHVSQHLHRHHSHHGLHAAGSTDGLGSGGAGDAAMDALANLRSEGSSNLRS